MSLPATTALTRLGSYPLLASLREGRIRQVQLSVAAYEILQLGTDTPLIRL